MKSLKQLSRFSSEMRKVTTIGDLIGIELPARDKLVKDAADLLEARIEEAKKEAASTGKTVQINVSRFNCTYSDDFFMVNPDGTLDRKLGTYPGFSNFLEKSRKLEYLPDTASDRMDTLSAAFNGLWSPSATNWQPIRLVEIGENLLNSMPPFADNPVAPGTVGLILLRRRIYESLLEDVLQPFGFHVNAKEELIDWGIFSEVFKMSIKSRGRGLISRNIADAEVACLTNNMVSEISGRLVKLKQYIASSMSEESRFEAKKEIDKAGLILSGLKNGTYIPSELLVAGKQTGEYLFPDFDTVVYNRSSERVALQDKTMPDSQIRELINLALSTFTPAERETFKIVYFNKENQVPIGIGQSMFFALYGDGADLDTKKGGINGFVPGMNISNFLKVLIKRFPEEIEDLSCDKIDAMDNRELKQYARKLPVKDKYLGSHILNRLVRDGKYSVLENGIIASENGKSLSSLLLVRVMANLAINFGNFFLKFQNTHPYTLIFLAKQGKNVDETSMIYSLIGRAVAIMALHARSLGLCGIVKTGPIDVARARIRELLTEYILSDEKTAQLGNDLQDGLFKPALFYQVGHPLTAESVVDKGEPTEHTGFEERKRDKRPPRCDSTDHYLPVI